MALLLQLEASLQASQIALLARDLARIEQGTRDQIRLLQELEILSAPGRGLEEGSPGKRNSCAPSSDGPLTAELRAAQLRVLHLGRVQTALLVRGERSLRILSHLVAGAQSNYGPPAANHFKVPGKAGGLYGEDQK
jgi:hypothetical protein